MDERGSTHPLLAKMAVKRTDMHEIPGHYSRTENVWVVETSNGTVPLITEAQKAIAMLQGGPITKVQGERDELEALSILETSTKTRAQLERDDQSGPSFGFIHELPTKTEVVQERDDASPAYMACLLELATKTETKRERDDQ
jgi:hypothetical protein